MSAASARSASPPVVALIGGATAGAEVAGRLAKAGAVVVVFEQNARPYGKIEDGLPRWHVALRRKEYETISSKLDHPNIHYVPCTKIGPDLDFTGLVQGWGFDAVVLACGAWRDRPLPVEGADRYVGRGLIYQNPFVIWFNHAPEQGYRGPRFEVADGMLVVGGGLASIDVAKILMLETTRSALAERGIRVTILELEQRGIPKELAKHGLCFEELGLEGCTLVYRRRPEDMPLVEIPAEAPPSRRLKVAQARRKLLEKAIEKYRFRFEPLAMPDELLVEEDRLVGLRFRRTRVEQGKVLPTDATFERRAPFVVSSIGSIPEPILGIEMKGELFRFIDWELGRIEGHPTVFSAGNVVTGKGNIVASRKHATQLSQHVIERFLGLGPDGSHEGEEALLAPGREAAARTAEAVEAALDAAPPPPADRLERLLARVHDRQRAVGYDGNYLVWMARVSPPDMP